MSVFSKRNLSVGIAIFVIGVGACAAIWGVRRFMRRSTSINSQVTAYLLDDRGEVNGLLLASGDQLHFSPQTGAVVASQIKVGDEVTVSGHPGSHILGDQIGYGLSRWGGRPLIDRITRRLGGESKIKKAEALSEKWGGPGIFFSRWLITELGPWLNVTSGIAAYPWRRFIFWDVLGEVLWVVLYVMLGYIFSDRVQYISEILGNLAWAIFALIIAIVLGWKLFRYFRPAVSVTTPIATD